MYYRVAIQVDAVPTWQWKSTVLSSLDTLFQFLRLLWGATSSDGINSLEWKQRQEWPGFH